MADDTADVRTSTEERGEEYHLQCSQLLILLSSAPLTVDSLISHLFNGTLRKTKICATQDGILEKVRHCPSHGPPSSLTSPLSSLTWLRHQG